MPLPPPPTSKQDLLPLDHPEWDWKQFERFCLGLVRAQSEVADAHLYGTRGQDQQGIDIVAELTDGRCRTYQCRKWRSYSARDAEKTVEETTYGADEHVVLVTCEVRTQVRDVIDRLEHWSLLDKEDLSRAVRDIEPRERARRLVEDTFNVGWRRAFLGPAGPLGFWETDDYFRALLDGGRLFKHTWDLVGRAHVLDALTQALAADAVRVVVLVGRGGIGKTRLLLELAQAQQSKRTVLFADDHVPLTAESVDELPWTGPLVVVDDAHRRDDLGPLMSAARRRDDRLAVVLATRPHRVEELRAQLSLTRFAQEEMSTVGPLGDLEETDVRSLARQALGPAHIHLADHLAAATADCPLVTVIGGQLLAQRAVAPELLERESDFRQAVLDRFRDEMLGRLGDDVEPDLARHALVLLSALGPVSTEAGPVLERMSEDLGVEEHTVRSLLSLLEDAGVVIARGRLRRIVPDVLADHILHRACVDGSGNATGRADALLARYGDVALVSLLRNLAELDWRIAQGESDAALLGAFWEAVRSQFVAADAEQRLRVIELIKPVARLAPAAVFAVVRDALEHPAETARMPLFGYEVTDDDVRRALPPLVGSIALTPNFLPDAVALLWELGRDDERRLPPNPEHAVRVLEDLADYQLPPGYARAVFELAVRLLSDSVERDERARSPLELLRPLLAREGTSMHSMGLGIQMGAYSVSAQATADLRESMRAILVEQALGGTFRNRVLASVLLGEALTQPHGYFGQAVSDNDLQQWHGDQLALLTAIEEVMARTDDPHVRLELRSALEWHAGHSAWPDIAERARAVREVSPTDRETLVRALRAPIEWRDRDGSAARLRRFATRLAGASDNPHDLAERLDAELQALDALPQAVHPDAGPLLVALAESDAALGAALAQWCAANSARPLARFGASLLSVVGTRRPEEVRGLLEGLRSGDVPARRQLASYLSMGTWFGAPDGPEANLLRELAADDDPIVVRTVLLAVLRLAHQHSELAIEVALDANIGSDSHRADDLCTALDHVTDQLGDEEVRRLLDKLRPVTTLEYWPNRVLAKVAPNHRDDVLEFLLNRASAGGDVQSLSFHDYDVDLLGGAQGDALLRVLRRVRDASIGAARGLVWELAQLYWRLTSDLQASLTVISEWLTDEDEARVDAALSLVDGMPWSAALAYPDFVDAALTAAQARGGDGLDKVRNALFSVVAISGSRSRTMGQPAPRDVRLRDQGRVCAERYAPATPTRRFFEDVVKRAEANIREAELEDEEYPER